VKPRPSADDSLTAELKALAAVGHALADLDPAARARVLRWAIDRFDVDPIQNDAPNVRQQQPEHAAPLPDTTLLVDDIEDLFDDPVHRESREVDTNGICQRPAPPPRAVARAQPTESLLSGFVAEFQQLVVQWQGG
jgi:hypothetical protein